MNSPHKLKDTFRKALWIIPLGIAGNLIFSWLSTPDSGWTAFKSLDARFLALALFLGFIQWFTNTARVLIWTRFLGHRFAFRDMLKLVIGSELGSSLSPTALGGGYVKLGMLIARGLSPGRAASLMTLGTVEDTTFFLAAVPVALTFAPSHIPEEILPQFPVINLRNILIVAGGAFLIFTVLSGLGKYTPIKKWHPLQRIRDWFDKMAADFMGVYRLIAAKGKTRLLLTIALTSLQWTCRFSVLMALLASLHIPFDVIQIFFCQWAVYLLTMFIPTPGGSGGAEASFFIIYKALIPGSLIGLVTAAWRFLTYYIQLTVGAVVFSLINLKKKSIGNHPETHSASSLKAATDPAFESA